MPDAQPLKVVYFGSGRFAVRPLAKLIETAGVTVAAVVTQPDRPAGRAGLLKRSPVADLAADRKLKLLQPKTYKKDPEVERQLRELGADVFVVASYGKILPGSILNIPRLGSWNLHGSILPKFRGASPIQWAILAGDKTSGVSLTLMDDDLDHGPVLATVEQPIGSGDTFGSLEERLSIAAAQLLADNLPKIAAGAKGTPQDHANATYTRILERDDGFMHWDDETAAQAERKLRAFDPWPGAFCLWKRKDKVLRIKITTGRVLAAAEAAGAPETPGTAFKTPSGLPAVRCKTGALELVELQVEGKKPVGGAAFLNGYPDFVGSKLETWLPELP